MLNTNSMTEIISSKPPILKKASGESNLLMDTQLSMPQLAKPKKLNFDILLKHVNGSS
jgi:hypothetical protein